VKSPGSEEFIFSEWWNPDYWSYRCILNDSVTLLCFCISDEISSVDILELAGCFYVDLLHTKHKELRRHSGFYVTSDNATGNFRHIAKYRMRSMKDAAELFVLLYKFVSDSLSGR
jgi:hypothetical protein